MLRALWNNRSVRRILQVFADSMIVVAAVIISLLLRFECQVPGEYWPRAFGALLWMVPCYVAANFVGSIYRVLWRYASGTEFLRLGCCAGGAMLATVLVNQFFRLRLPNSVLLLTGAFCYGLFSVLRYCWKLLLQQRHMHKDEKEVPVPPESLRRLLIVGAGSAGAWAVSQCREQRYGAPVLIVDDAPIKRGLFVQGVPVLGTVQEVPALVKAHQIDDIVMAIPSLKGKRLSEIATLCASTHCRVTTLTDPKEIDSTGKPKAPVMRKLNTADFLSRDEIKLDVKSISGYLAGSTVLVTGGGGSIGSEICRQVMRFLPKQLIVFDIYENCAYELYYELRQQYGPDVPVTVLVGSIRDRGRLDEVMERYHPDVVFHAAAHKHVPLMEESPAEAVKNNVFGTRNTLLSAAEHGVKRFVILSTDKAVNPTNIMGATKRITEMIVQTLGPKTGMKCMAVRFGNVLGSHGSVIPLFEEQIRKGGPVTVTDPEMTRYFMTIPEAAQLVLQAGGIARDGAIFVLDMGEPVKILDLAQRLIRFYGYEPGVDMKIKITGLRPGEKLYEELLMDEEADAMTHTAHDMIFVAPPIRMDETLFLSQLDRLEKLCEHNTPALVKVIQETVTTYRPWEETKVG